MAFLTDTFTDVDGTDLDSHPPDVGGTWINNPNTSLGVPEIRSGLLVPQNTSPALWYNNVDPGSNDYYCEADVTRASDANYAGPAIYVSPTTYTGYYGYYTNGAWHLFVRNDAGTETELGTAYTVTWASARVRVQRVGTTVTLHVDGTIRITATDSSIASRGFAGVRMRGGSPTTGYRLDNLGADLAGVTNVAKSGADAFTVTESATRSVAVNLTDAATVGDADASVTTEDSSVEGTLSEQSGIRLDRDEDVTFTESAAIDTGTALPSVGGDTDVLITVRDRDVLITARATGVTVGG